MNETPTKTSYTKKLTNRERDVFYLLADGLASKEIADKLFVSLKTVETHIINIMRKFETRSRGELIARYYKYCLAQRKKVFVKRTMPYGRFVTYRRRLRHRE